MRKEEKGVSRTTARHLYLFRNVLHNADLIGAQLIMPLFHKMSSIPPYSGWWQTPQHLAKCSQACIPSPREPPWTKKGQNPVSCILDELGFVQTAFLGMVLANVPNHTGRWGLFFSGIMYLEIERDDCQPYVSV